MNEFPVDSWSVKEFGIERWLKETPPWPVKPRELRALGDEVEELFIGLIVDSGPEIADALLSIYKLTIQLATLLNDSLVLKRLRESGWSPTFSLERPGGRYYSGLIKGNNEDGELFHPGLGKLIPRKTLFGERVKDRLGALLRNCKYRAWGMEFPGGWSDYAVTIRHPGPRLETYALSRGKRIGFVSPLSCLAAAKDIEDSLAAQCDKVSRTLADGIGVIGRRYGLDLQPQQLERLGGDVKSSLLTAVEDILAIRSRLRKKRPALLLVNGLGRVSTRELCVAARREGCHIVGEEHGHNFGIVNHNVDYMFELSLLDTCLVSSPGAARLLSQTKDKFQPGISRDVCIESVGSAYYQKLWEKNSAQPLASEIRTIMFVEYPFTEFRHKEILAHWPYVVDFVLRTADLLRQNGVRVIMKRHPDRLNESERAYEPYFDEVLTDPFETVCDRADALFFSYLPTTTFGYSLLTNKPIIFFETLLEDIVDEAAESLRKRCRVVPSLIDESGRVEFDGASLLRAVRQKPAKPDDEFFRKFVLSGNKETA